MKYTIVFLCIGLLSVSCEKKDNSHEASALYEESMKIHDEIMPRMDELFRLRQRLNGKLDTLKTDSVANAVLIDDVRKGIRMLAEADKEMMDWMHNVKDVPGSGASAHHHGDHDEHGGNLSEEEILKIQKKQKEDVEKIRKDMEASIENAKRLLSKNH